MADNIEHETQTIRPPHDALFLALTYLPLLDLLSISETCTSMRDAVLNDALPWFHIKVDRVLGYRLLDEILMKYASKANGGLRSLVMVKCVKITDDGLRQVLEQNPLVTKLHVPGCTGLTPEGIVAMVKSLSNHGPYLTSLKANGLYNINQEHLESLRTILMTNLKNNKFPDRNKNDALIDIDICPICNEVRQVFICSEENCTRKNNGLVRDYCKGCSSCISRCIECEKCIDVVEEIEEAACEDTLCVDCWLKLPKCSLCNKPYCKEHADLQLLHTASEGFVCENCLAKLSNTRSLD